MFCVETYCTFYFIKPLTLFLFLCLLWYINNIINSTISKIFFIYKKYDRKNINTINKYNIFFNILYQTFLMPRVFVNVLVNFGCPCPIFFLVSFGCPYAKKIKLFFTYY